VSINTVIILFKDVCLPKDTCFIVLLYIIESLITECLTPKRQSSWKIFTRWH